MVDSSCCLPAQTLKDSGIIVVPHQLIADGRVYRDGIDLNTSDFYRMQSVNGTLITTSGPNPQAFLEAFQQAAKESQSILCITLSPRFSPVTYDSARIAARLALDERPDLEIHVLDSRAVAGSQGFVALEAHRASQEGLNLSETVARIEDLVPRLHLLAYLDTLKVPGTQWQDHQRPRRGLGPSSDSNPWWNSVRGKPLSLPAPAAAPRQWKGC